MDKTAINAIAEMSAPNYKEVNGFLYSDKPMSVIHTPQIAEIKFSTLNGLLDTLANELNDILTYPDDKLIIHIKNADTVGVISPIHEEDNSRDYPYSAHAQLPSYNFGRYIPYEEMVIALKSKFVPSDELNELVQLMGTITMENNAVIADDGFTQTVTVKKGVMLKENKAINPYFKLKPYRTFVECEQPESIFLLRVKDNCAALFEADGGAWELDARAKVKQYIINHLKGISDTAIDRVLVVE